MERDEHDVVQQRKDTVTKFSDQRHKKSHKRQEHVLKDQANEPSSAARQTAQQKAANSAEETAKTDSNRYHSGSDRDGSRVRIDVMPESGEVMTTEYATVPSNKRGSQEGVASSAQACMRVEKVQAYLCKMGTCWLQCVIMIMLDGMYYIVPIWLLNCLSVNSHIANGMAIR